MNSRYRGFSLIELSVVLVLISLASAIVVPNLSGAYSRSQTRGELEAMLLQLSSLGYKGYSDGVSITVDSVDSVVELLDVPPDWSVEILSPIKVTNMGVCLGGELVLANADFSSAVRLTQPYCQVEELRSGR